MSTFRRPGSRGPSRYAFVITAATLLAVGSAHAAPEQAGVAAAVRGNVLLASATDRPPGSLSDVIGRDIASGDRIFLGDEIETGPESGLQIMLLDETIFTIGHSSAMTIDTFVYYPASGAGEVSARILKGTSRFVSGQVAKAQPDRMSVKLPVGTIGIRGTSAAGVVNGQSSQVVLLGPGPDNNADEQAARIIVDNGGQSVEITRPGFGTTIDGVGGTPTPPVRFSADAIQQITGPLGGGPQSPGQNRQAGGAAEVEQASNNQRSASPGLRNQATGSQTKPANVARPALGASTSASILKGSGQNLGSSAGSALSQFNAQIVKSNQAAAQAEASEQQQSFADGITDLDALRALDTGIFNFTGGAFALAGTGVAGTYEVTYSVDFGNSKTSGNIRLSTGNGFAGGVANFPLIHNLFDNTGSQATQEETESIVNGNIISGSFPGANVSGTNSIAVNYALVNKDGALANILATKVSYSEGGNTAQGDGKTARKQTLTEDYLWASLVSDRASGVKKTRGC